MLATTIENLLSTVDNATQLTTQQQTAKMTSRAVVTIISADGKPSSNTHPLPNVFKAPIRPDIVQYD